MADIAGIVIAAVQISAKVACLGYEYIVGWKEAPSEIRRLIDELRSLHNTLIALQDCVSKNPQSPLLQQFNRGDGPLLRCNVVLSEFRLKLEKMRDSKGRRLKWLLSKKDTLEIISRIEGYKSLFTLALAVDEREIISTATQRMDLKANIIIQNQKSDSDAQRDWRGKLENSRIAADQCMGEIKEDIRKGFDFQRDWRQQEEDRVHSESTQKYNEDVLNRKKEEASKREEILALLFSGMFENKHLEIRRRRQEGTGGWLLESLEFQKWLGRPDIPLLWGYGIPGAGKTFLASRVIDFFKDQLRASNYGIAYIYFDYKESDTQLPTYVLTSLLKQLCNQLPELPKEVESLFEVSSKKQRGEKPALKDLCECLVAVSKSFKKVFVVCDALDECNPAFRKELLPQFHQMGKSGVKIFLTSRQHPEDIQESLRNSAKVKLSANGEDIETYVRQKIDDNVRIKRLAKQARCEDRIISDLTECANGMFLLVHFHIKYLCQQTTPKQVLISLDKIQSQISVTQEGLLDPVYDRVVEGIKEQQRSSSDLALAVLSWLVMARRTLLVDELQVALAIEKGRYYLDELDFADRGVLLEVCAGFVVIDENENGDTIRLAHYTVQEYLLRNSIILESTEFKISTACLTYLSFSIFTNWTHSYYPKFLSYAATYLRAHLSACDEVLLVDAILNFLARGGNVYLYLKFINDNKLFNRSQQGTIPEIVKSTAAPLRPFFAAIILGNYRVLRLLLESAESLMPASNISSIITIAKSEGNDRVVKLLQTGFDLSAPEMQRNQGLCLAASLGYSDLVQLLLEKGADISGVDWAKRTVLDVAAYGGYYELVGFLVKKGAHFSAECGFQTVLAEAVRYTNLEAVRVLLQSKSDILTVSNSQILFQALRGRDFEMVKLLLENGANASAVGFHGMGALLVAVDKGASVDLVQLFLEKGADISVVDYGGCTALHYAVLRGNIDQVQLLLEKGADISVVDARGCPILHHAISQADMSPTVPDQDRINMLRLLIEKGADISALDTGGYTALHHAIPDGSVDLVQLLLEKGADISVLDPHGRTVLHLAIYKASVDLVRLLLGKGADISVLDSNGFTVLHYAILGEDVDLVRLLLEKGADISLLDSRGFTPLHCAIHRGSVDLVRLLLEKGADISALNLSGRTALHAAASMKSFGLVHVLPRGGTNISMLDPNNPQEYEVILYGVIVNLVQLLLEKGADISAVDSQGQTVLHIATLADNFDVVELLLEKGVDISAVDSQGQTVLHHAVHSESVDLVELLLEKDVDISAADQQGQTALHHALSCCESEAKSLLASDTDFLVDNISKNLLVFEEMCEPYIFIINLLLDKGADISVPDFNGITPLEIAARCKYIDLYKLSLGEDIYDSVVDDNGINTLHVSTSQGN